jgi:hypothetical protein
VTNPTPALWAQLPLASRQRLLRLLSQALERRLPQAAGRGEEVGDEPGGAVAAG